MSAHSKLPQANEKKPNPSERKGEEEEGINNSEEGINNSILTSLFGPHIFQTSIGIRPPIFPQAVLVPGLSTFVDELRASFPHFTYEVGAETFLLG
jgi:hypothetical protein